MMKLCEHGRKCRVALIAIADRYLTHRLPRNGSGREAPSQLTSFTSGFHARCNRSDHHRGHLELVGAIDDAVTRGDPRKVGVDRPDRAGVVLSLSLIHISEPTRL